MTVTSVLMAKRLDTPVTMGALLNAYNCESAFRMPVPGAFLNGGQLARAALVDMLSAWVTGLTAPKLELYTNPLTPTPTSTYADFTKPTASWYTAPVLVIGAVFLNGDGTIEIDGVSHQFNYSGVDPSVDIYGYLWTDTV